MWQAAAEGIDPNVCSAPITAARNGLARTLEADIPERASVDWDGWKTAVPVLLAIIALGASVRCATPGVLTDSGRGYQASEKPVGGAIADAVLSKRVDDPAPAVGGAYHNKLACRLGLMFDRCCLRAGVADSRAADKTK
jgi:hypothetical protein